jgi:hypothetical protein
MGAENEREQGSFGVAQLHAGFQYPDPSHWSQQLDWYDEVDNYELTDVT